MTLIDKEAAMLRLAFEAAARGAKPGDSYVDAVNTAVATLYPSEAGRLVAALEVLLSAAQKVAGAQVDDTHVERQRAADRVSAFLDAGRRHDGSDRRLNYFRQTEPGSPSLELHAEDLRLLVQAAPSLPPKWSAPLTGRQQTEPDVDGGKTVSADETLYLAVSRQRFAELAEETRVFLAAGHDDFSWLLQRWLSLQVSSTEVAAVPGSTRDSQAQITALLKDLHSMSQSMERQSARYGFLRRKLTELGYELTPEDWKEMEAGVS